MKNKNKLERLVKAFKEYKLMVKFNKLWFIDLSINEIRKKYLNNLKLITK